MSLAVENSRRLFIFSRVCYMKIGRFKRETVTLVQTSRGGGFLNPGGTLTYRVIKQIDPLSMGLSKIFF